METKGGYNIKLVTFIFDWYTFHNENNYCFYLYYQLISLAHAICTQNVLSLVCCGIFLLTQHNTKRVPMHAYLVN